MGQPTSGGAANTRLTEPPHCPSAGVCIIDVDLDANPQCGDNCTPQAPFVIYVDPGPHDSLKLVWRIVRNTDATFPNDGIAFVDAGSGFQCSGGDLGPSPDRRTFTCRDQHIQKAQGWKYWIRIKPRDRPTQHWDPWVVNR
jgi:hypothetical protein